MDDLNNFVRAQGFPSEMRVRLREYFNQTKHLQLASQHRALLKMMSPALQGEVALRWHEHWLRRVWFLSGTEPEFLVQVLQPPARACPPLTGGGVVLPLALATVAHALSARLTYGPRCTIVSSG